MKNICCVFFSLKGHLDCFQSVIMHKLNIISLHKSHFGDIPSHSYVKKTKNKKLRLTSFTQIYFYKKTPSSFPKLYHFILPVGTSEKHSAAHVHQNLGSVVFSVVAPAKALMFYFMVIFIYTPDG